MLTDDEKAVAADPLKNKTKYKESFINAQRIIWEKSIFPSLFPSCSTYLCTSCRKKAVNLSICLECDHIYCLNHFKDHICEKKYGIDILTRQFFAYDKNRGRRFIFDAFVDRLLISCKLAVIDGVKIDTDHDPEAPILSNHRLPRPFPNLGNTCWLNSVIHCMLVNPLFEKWFLSGKLFVEKISEPEEALHMMIEKLFRSQNGNGDFNIIDLLFCISAVFPQIDTKKQNDAEEFFMYLCSTLHDFYQKKLSESDAKEFSDIYTWTFNIVESCEHCGTNHTRFEEETILRLTALTSSSLNEALIQFLSGESPLPCSQCKERSKKQYYFHTLPHLLIVSLTKTRGDKSMNAIQVNEKIDLTKFLSDSKANVKANYTLISTIIRTGSGEDGHIRAYVSRNGRWFKCDDNQVNQSSIGEALREEVSLLFYVRSGFTEAR